MQDQPPINWLTVTLSVIGGTVTALTTLIWQIYKTSRSTRSRQEIRQIEDSRTERRDLYQELKDAQREIKELTNQNQLLAITVAKLEFQLSLRQQEPTPKRKQSFRILCIDDERAFWPLLRAAIETDTACVYAFDFAATFADGLQLLESILPSLILLDINLPCIDTLEGLVRLRALYPDVPVIVISGDNTKGLEAREKGATGFLSKPFRAEILVAAVRRALGL